MLLTQLDMPTSRYVCYANEGFISYRIDAQRQYIEFEQSENISSSSFVNIFHESEYIDRRKREQEYKDFLLVLLLSFFLYRGLGLAHLYLTSQMRCSHLAVFCKFSAKNITHSALLLWRFILRRNCRLTSDGRTRVRRAWKRRFIPK